MPIHKVRDSEKIVRASQIDANVFQTGSISLTTDSVGDASSTISFSTAFSDTPTVYTGADSSCDHYSYNTDTSQTTLTISNGGSVNTYTIKYFATTI